MKYLLFAVVLFIACGPQQISLEERKAEVMKIHDDSMAEMGKIREAVFNLSDLAKTNQDSLKIKKIVSDLEAADEGMMVWMSEYKEPSEVEMKAFLILEKDRIQQIANNIYKSLEDAQKYIDK